jgi:hypothetical protein
MDQIQVTQKIGHSHAWLVSQQLAGTEDMARASTMWAAADLPAFQIIRRAHPKVRTMRGLHAKWNEANRPQPKPELDGPR